MIVDPIAREPEPLVNPETGKPVFDALEVVAAVRLDPTGKADMVTVTWVVLTCASEQIWAAYPVFAARLEEFGQLLS